MNSTKSSEQEGSEERYRAIEEWSDEFHCPVWGIGIYNQKGECEGKIQDITPDDRFAVQLAKLLNQEQLEAVHLKDVVEDFLACPERLAAIIHNHEDF